MLQSFIVGKIVKEMILQINNIKRILIFSIVFFCGCNRPLDVNKLHEHKSYLNINDALSDPLDVYMLHLDDSTQKIKTDDLVTFRNIQRLEINSKVDIDTFPNKLSGLSKLQWIIITDNNIKLITPQIHYLRYIEILDLSNNKIEELPLSLCYYQGPLGSLRLSGNKIKEVPRGIENLKDLYHLDLDNNCISNLPLEIGELYNLTSLGLANNQLVELPWTVKKLYKNLEVIDISGNNISDEHIKWLEKHLPYTKIITNRISN